LDHLVRTAAAAADALTGALAEAGHPGRTPLADPAADADHPPSRHHRQGSSDALRAAPASWDFLGQSPLPQASQWPVLVSWDARWVDPRRNSRRVPVGW
ncbi:MAG TPA: hypothetical protein VLR26_07140, partial [Frankiaceae bacterium]|nr:hypothetical protein [Frankiaceae bacterium]